MTKLHRRQFLATAGAAAAIVTGGPLLTRAVMPSQASARAAVRRLKDKGGNFIDCPAWNPRPSGRGGYAGSSIQVLSVASGRFRDAGLR
ncbi:twin-arginine translocation signal domain-containing protein [Kribbella sp. NBC_01245]|uniref:twin-arginine translocation signal domain-containing protein n=1 Tax=Kribbella sp. NBC_01245 TaxID=2903578 RepID=UPI003FA5D03A